MKVQAGKHVFESDLSDDEAIAVVDQAVSDGTLTGEFPTSLVKQYRDRGTLSERQWPWIQKLANDVRSPKPEPVDDIELLSILAMFDHARQTLKWPKITVKLSEKVTIRIALVGPRSPIPGSLRITNGKHFDKPGYRYYGRILPDGKLQRARDGTPEALIKILLKMNKNPQVFAFIYGQRFGHCCFCARELTDHRSVEAGYGPICAGKWGLQWGVPTGDVDDSGIFEEVQ